ncbi:MAG: hypothetical protein ACOX8S_03630 [Christensenellales bacterium]
MFRLEDGKALAELRFVTVGEYLRLDVLLRNETDDDWSNFSLALRLPIPQRDSCNVTMPHVIYNDNPSASPERLVPHIGKEPGKGLVVEEHRLPIPAVNVEWGQEGSERFLTLLSLPDVTTGNEEDFWSLGAIFGEETMDITALSGPLMFNGEKDFTYGAQCKKVAFEGGYRTLPAGGSICKTFFIHAGKPEGRGKGFRSIIRMGYDVLKPSAKEQHSLQKMIEFKKNVMDHRFHEGNHSLGYICYGASNKFGDISGRPEYYLYAWTGQALKLAWCDCLLGIKHKEDENNKKENESGNEEFRLKRGMDVADFYVKGSEANVSGLHRAYYYHQSDSWGVPFPPGGAQEAQETRQEKISSRMQGEAYMDLIDIMLLLRESGISVPSHWEDSVKDCCNFLMNESYQNREGIYPLFWTPDGKIPDGMINAAGMPCVAALARAYRYFGEKAYIEYAIKKYEIYYDLHMRTFDRPFARSTMDARCEDKEAGLYFFVAAHELFKATGQRRFADWAAIAADWILTFVYFWDTGFEPHTICARKNFSSVGWPGVSVQNHHLDVFFPTYELYEYGALSKQPFYSEMALNVKNALTYGVCTYPGEWGFSVIGEQGEQYYQTNYGFDERRRFPQLKRDYIWRGGMHVWNPSWITAQVLQSSLRLHYGT